MEIYNIITLMIVLAAVFGYLNHRFIRLPGVIGIMLISLVASLVVVGLGKIFPEIFNRSIQSVSAIDFNTVVLKVMLSFLLFAAAIHVDLKKLKKERISIITFSTIGMLISTFLVATLIFFVVHLFGMEIHFLYCLLFGSLISPTDPIAVIGILKKAGIPPSLETRISGESLFNDGVAVVLFLTFYEVARMGSADISVSSIGWLFIKEAVGGLVFGWLLGYAGFLALKSINNYVVEVMITLAIVMGGYTVAGWLHVSGPLAMVVAGLITGNKSLDTGVSEITRDYINKFWEMVDEVMNAILFLLMGFEMLIIPFNHTLFWLGCLTIVIVLFARFISVFLPIVVLNYRKTFKRSEVMILTWGGLRGGISVALALSLPASMYGETLVSITYSVVLFSILVQGLTIGKIARSAGSAEPTGAVS
ncbi:MAG: sodium:proton antiporter [Bacteroidota bacterium]|nr:sodium:proton antiporter [Bacteroidota bacterium]